MAKFLGATSLVALALLGCLVGTGVEAQTSYGWMQPYTKPQTPPNNQGPQGHLPPPHSLNPTNPQHPNPGSQHSWNPTKPQHPNPGSQQPWNPPNSQHPNPGSQQPWNPPNSQQPNPGSQPWNPPNSQHPNPGSQPWNPPNSQHPNPPYHHQKGSPLLSADHVSQNPQLPKQQKPVTPQRPHVSTPQRPHVSTPQKPHVSTPQKPHVSTPQKSHVSTPQKPHVSPPTQQHPHPRNCQVDLSVRITCGHPAISASECEALNCCFEGNHCYFGKAVTVGCTKSGLFLVVAAKDATQPNIDLETMSLLEAGQGCTHVDSNSQFAIYQFPVTACGSVVMEEPGVIIYENRLTSAYEVGVGPRGAITRDSYYELLFQCRYIGTSVETLVVEVLPLDNPPLPVAARGPISVQLSLANGQCSTKGCNEVDVAYSSFYTEADYPVSKVLRDPVYVDVQLLGKTDPLLVLTLDRCWATTSPEPHSLPQWDILIGGCPYRDDRYLSSLVPVGQSSGLEFPSHHKRFIFKMFTFVNPTSMEPLRELVYIHCSTAVCYAAPGARCEQACLYRKRRDIADVSQEKSEPKIVVSSGPVSMVSPQE